MKIGDRVRILRDSDGTFLEFKGRIGIIVLIFKDRFAVQFEQNYPGCNHSTYLHADPNNCFAQARWFDTVDVIETEVNVVNKILEVYE